MSRLIVNGGRKISRNNSKLIILSRALSSGKGIGEHTNVSEEGKRFSCGGGRRPDEKQLSDEPKNIR